MLYTKNTIKVIFARLDALVIWTFILFTQTTIDTRNRYCTQQSE